MRKIKRMLATSVVVAMTANSIPVMAAPVLEPGAPDILTPSDAIPKGTLALNGLFDVKSLEAGTSKYLYINTYPEKGTEITEVTSSNPEVVSASYGNNTEGMTEEPGMEANNSNYNFVQLDAKTAGDATITVTVTDTAGNLGSVTKSFEVQVIPPEYENTQRVITDISDNWKFLLERDMETRPEEGQVPSVENGMWEDVTIPHCWNIDDGADGGNNYHKGIGWYVRDFSPEELSEELYEGKQIYLEMGAACKISEIYVNGTKVDRHEGGYSRIRVDLTDYLNLGQANTVAISVDNRVNDLTPISGDFTVFGGLYRDISLIATGDVHMDLGQETSYGGRGLYVSQRGTQDVTKDTKYQDVYGNGGKLNVSGEVKNSAAEAKEVSAEVTVYDADWQEVASHTFETVSVDPGAIHNFTQEVTVAEPHLWDGVNDPYQYNVEFEVSVDGQVVDRERDRIGFRFFCSDPEEGFFLNGRSYPLRGVNSHQDRYARGCAATHQDREQDMALMDEIGANAIRFAHYQHDPFVYELAAERGITVWAEIPMVNSIRNTDKFYESTDNNLKELIHQAYNIPSVLMWGIHNEQWPKNSGITVLLDQLYKTCKAEDPSRLVTVATAQDPGSDVNDALWDSITLSWQSDVSAWNKYFGLYNGKGNWGARYFGNWINQVYQYGQKHKTIYGTSEATTAPDGSHRDIPVYVHGNVGMSEYGAEGNPYIHDEKPGYSQNENNLSEEWQALFHEIYYKVIDESPWMWGSYIWNMFEFGSDGRGNAGRQGTNNKGIVSYDRTIKKDSFYFYKANWSDEPTLNIAGKRFETRNQDDIRVKVYSNMKTVELFVDGVSQGVLEAGSNLEPEKNNDGQPDETLIPNTQLGKFTWDIKLAGQGAHQVVAVGTDAEGNVYTDTVQWNRQLFANASITSGKYNINSASHTISGVPGGTTLEEFRSNVTAVQNSTYEVYTAEGILIDDPNAQITLGMRVHVVAEDGVASADYIITSAPITQGKSVTASSNQDNYGCANAVDGNTATRWGSGGSFPGWIQVDLGDTYTLSGLDTLWYASSARNYTFEVQGSIDGQNYETLLPSRKSEQGAVEPTWTKQNFEDGAQARYLKIQVITSTSTGGSPSIYEIQATGLRVTSDEYSVNNAERTIVGVMPETTTEELLSHVAVDGDYNSIRVENDTDGVVTYDTVLVVNYADGREITYTLATEGPDERPISQGKNAVALDIEVNGVMIPNEDSGDGCGLGTHHDTASNIVDGDLTTRWTGALTGGNHTVPSTAYPAEVLIDLENEYTLNNLFIRTYDPTNRYYQFAVYAGNDPETIKQDENMVLNMLDNTSFSDGYQKISGNARYILLSVTNVTGRNSYRAASVFELGIYGYRVDSTDYTISTDENGQNLITGVSVETTVADFLSSLGIEGNYSVEVVLGDKVLSDEDRMTPGVELHVSDLNGQNPVSYMIHFEEDSSMDVPVSQGMPVEVSKVEVGGVMIPHEDANDGCGKGTDHDVAANAVDGDVNTFWTGALIGANHSVPNKPYPASIRVDMTDLNSTDEYYYLTGVTADFFTNKGKRSYNYNISAKNIVGIETGFEVNGANSTTQGHVEHWTEKGTDTIKDLTLIVTGSNQYPGNNYAGPKVAELRVYAWRVYGRDYPIDETNKVIRIGENPVTLSVLRNGLEIVGNCDVKFVNAEGTELGWNDMFGEGCKMIVTDVRGHEFVYTASAEGKPEEPENYYTTEIRVAEKPSKLVYGLNDKFEPEGMIVEAVQKASPSNAEQVVELSNEELKYTYDFSEAGEKEVTITYEEKDGENKVQKFETSVMVTVDESISGEDEYYTTEIVVAKEPEKMEYKVGEAFDPAGMVVEKIQKATSSNAERTEEIPNEELDFTYDFDAAGEKEVIITYQDLAEDGVQKDFTASLMVMVDDTIIDEDEVFHTTKIRVKEKPSKLVYAEDEKFDPSGMVVEAFQKATSSNAERVVTIPNGDLDYEYDFAKEGETKVTVVYEEEIEGQISRFEDFVTVTVDNSEAVEDEFYTTKIVVKKKPKKLAYLIGEEFDPEGMQVVAQQRTASGKEKTVKLSIDDLDYNYDFSKPGRTEVTIIYNGLDENLEDKDFTVKLRVDVAEASEEFYTKEIIITSLPTKTQYFTGDILNLDGLEVCAVEVNALTGEETEKVISEGMYKVTPTILMMPGTQIITVSYAAADEDGNAVFFEAKFQVKVRQALDDDDDDYSGSGSASGSGAAGVSSGRAGAVNGQWSQQADGSWNFVSGDKIYKNEWAYVANPYANTALGQSAADWFRFDELGRMLTGWFTDADGSRYYLNETSDGTKGHMVTGWKWIEDASGQKYCYYFNPVSDGTKGKLYVNTTTPDGYRVDEMGRWIP